MSRRTALSPSYLISCIAKEFTKIEHALEGVEAKLTPHVFRHAFAITFRLNGVDVYYIMRSRGHEKLETIQKDFKQNGHAINQWSTDALEGFV